MVLTSLSYGSPTRGSFHQFALVDCQSQAEKFRKIVEGLELSMSYFLHPLPYTIYKIATILYIITHGASL